MEQNTKFLKQTQGDDQNKAIKLEVLKKECHGKKAVLNKVSRKKYIFSFF